MENMFTPIFDVNPSKETSKIKARITRLFTMPNDSNFYSVGTIMLVLLDENDDKIQASIKQGLVRRFEKKLNEGRAYVITNFVVCRNGAKFRCTDHQSKINFVHSTLIHEVESTSIDLHGIRLKMIGSVETNNIDEKEAKRVTIELTDFKQTTLNCTLWDSYAEQIVMFSNNENNNSAVVLIQFAKITKSNDAISVSNSKYTWRMFINQDLPEIIEFKKSLETKDDPIPGVTHLSCSGTYSLIEDLLEKCEKKYLDEIRDVGKECICVVLATIVIIEEEYGWFYNTC